MAKSSIGKLLWVALVLVLAGCVPQSREQAPKAEIEFIDINPDMKIRRMIVANPRPKGIVLFLHGFPETLYAWKDIRASRAKLRLGTARP